jgi:hypothetical protein
MAIRRDFEDVYGSLLDQIRKHLKFPAWNLRFLCVVSAFSAPLRFTCFSFSFTAEAQRAQRLRRVEPGHYQSIRFLDGRENGVVIVTVKSDPLGPILLGQVSLPQPPLLAMSRR